MRKSQVIINLEAWHGGLTLNDISRDRGRGELGRGWSRGRGPLGLSTDIRWRQSQEHQAPVFSATSPDNCWLHKNVKTAETVADWLHETACAQSICPRVTMDKHCTGHWNWHSSVRTQESPHFTAPLFMVTSSSSQVLMVSWSPTPCLHYISWSQTSDRCAPRSESPRTELCRTRADETWAASTLRLTPSPARRQQPRGDHKIR